LRDLQRSAGTEIEPELMPYSKGAPYYLSYAAPYLGNIFTYLSKHLHLSCATPYLSYGTPYMSFASPIELRGILLSYAVFYLVTPHPCLSYAAPFSQLRRA
jgi:hypothetical protein